MKHTDVPPQWVQDGFFKGIKDAWLTPNLRSRAVWKKMEVNAPPRITFPVAQQWYVALDSVGEWMVFVGYGKECEYIMVQ